MSRVLHDVPTQVYLLITSVRCILPDYAHAVGGLLICTPGPSHIPLSIVHGVSSSEPSMAESHDLIDAQFDRAVEIVQSLPKTGPIQTDYEEKLTMYR